MRRPQDVPRSGEWKLFRAPDNPDVRVVLDNLQQIIEQSFDLSGSIDLSEA